MIRLTSADAELTLAPESGGRAASWVVDGLDLLTGIGTSPQQWGCYPMAPWAGRIRGNTVATERGPALMPETFDGWAIHGTVLDQGWTAEHIDASAARLTCPLGPHWPWAGHVLADWRLGDGRLDVGLTVVSEGDEFPATAGWHPWLRRRLDRGSPAVLHVAADAMCERGTDHLPTGELVPVPPGPYDDAFRVPERTVTVEWPGALQLTGSSSHPWFVVYDEPDDALCVEPQTDPPDGLAAAHRVRPDDPLVLSTTWTWTTLPAQADPGIETVPHHPEEPS